MTGAPRSPWPQRTTARASALLLVSGLLLLLAAARIEVPITETLVVPLDGPIVLLAAAATRAAAFTVLAIGTVGEVGVTAGSVVGRAALIIWGARDLVLVLLSLMPSTIASALGGLTVALMLLFAAAAVAAVIQVVRARVLSGVARWVLLPIAVVDCFYAALATPLPIPTGAELPVVTAISVWPTEFVFPLLTLLAGVALLLWGRMEALKHRAQVVHNAW